MYIVYIPYRYLDIYLHVLYNYILQSCPQTSMTFYTIYLMVSPKSYNNFGLIICEFIYIRKSFCNDEFHLRVYCINIDQCRDSRLKF